MGKFVAIIGDDCAAKKSVPNMLEISPVRCASHRFNHAVKVMIAENKALFQKGENVMKKV